MKDFIRFENDLYSKGYQFIAGVDEAGRGPLAGPVVAAAVIFKNNSYPEGIKDSKKISPTNREKLFSRIKSHCIGYGIGIISNRRIDEINILQATFEAMNIAVRRLKPSPQFILIDGKDTPIKGYQQRGIIKGDNKSVSIAAASILAKVVRDRIMVYLDSQYPGYNLASNKGYGSKEHIERIHKLGRSPIHRQSFKLWFDR